LICLEAITLEIPTAKFKDVDEAISKDLKNAGDAETKAMKKKSNTGPENSHPSGIQPSVVQSPNVNKTDDNAAVSSGNEYEDYESAGESDSGHEYESN
jgi:hypothetical protein